MYVSSITVPTGDFFVATSRLAIWSTVEPGIGIGVASVATLRPLFGRFLYHARNSLVRMSASGRSIDGIRKGSGSVPSSPKGPEVRTMSFPDPSNPWDSRRSTVVDDPRTLSRSNDMVQEYDFASSVADLTTPPRLLLREDTDNNTRPFDESNFAFDKSASRDEPRRCPQMDAVDFEGVGNTNREEGRGVDNGVDWC
jgi:hypothetical protein